MELEGLLTKLKMEHLDAQLDAVCEQAAQREMDYKSFLCEALAVEWRGRDQKGVEARLRQARLPWLKTLEQFDFDFQPSLDKRQVRELAGLSFIERAHNVVILGPPGVGKTQPSKYPEENEPCRTGNGNCDRPSSSSTRPKISTFTHQE